MIHSPNVQTHQQEASHARVLLDTLGMELHERVSVNEFGSALICVLFC